MASNVEKEPGSQGDVPPAQTTPSEPPVEKKKREYKDFGHDEDKGPSRKFVHLQRLGTASSHHFFPDALVDMSQVRHQFLGV